ncbi:hypothetical protein CUV01_11175 [Paracoccus tegillarcae]|uniref:Uncharacterized protein n=2 Tax=Paracoccus tegillarcae TaxID=1529068 RepID=A0A2K9EKF2_9RHOB|nr:hypothetical protein [Paracoccus tegillarcae]AUH33877.1 hypothetical protein CUV01_11175 [Paracoccus tegillarcae]
MQAPRKTAQAFNILIVAQDGRLAHQALIFAASLRAQSPGFQGRLIVAEPQPQAAWAGRSTRLDADHRTLLTEMGAETTPFTAQHFGASYPYGNKIEALSALPENEPFIFFDTDTVILDELADLPLDFSRPSASMRREGTWPQPPIYGPGYAGIWRSMYDRFGLDYENTLDLTQPDEHWERYLYFNAGWFFGADPVEFRRRFLEWALAVRDAPQDELANQVLDPWLDQAVLPLVIHSFGGTRPGPELDGLDGETTCHYRNLPLLYARESDRAIEVTEAVTAPNRIKRVLRDWQPARKLIYQGKGREKIRPLFDGQAPSRQERPIRQLLKDKGWWLT